MTDDIITESIEPLYLLIFEDGSLTTVKSISTDDKNDAMDGILDIIKYTPVDGYLQWFGGGWNVLSINNEDNSSEMIKDD